MEYGIPPGHCPFSAFDPPGRAGSFKRLTSFLALAYPQTASPEKPHTSMASITFDTLKFVHRLRESGIPESQAEAIAEAFKEASGEAETVTKEDLKLAVAELRTELHKETRDLKVDLIKWMTGALIAQAAVIATLVKLL